jgi:putative cardiolipin synthase
VASELISGISSNESETNLGRSVLPLLEAHREESGVFPLRDGREAFAARALLADAAERTLDIQYYIWHGDLSGTLLFQAIRRAAERGVKVRLLLDDINTDGLDPLLAALDDHPNIEIRLFNPFRFRRWRWLGYLIDFPRANRRMHNKSFTADSQATIIGGRNIGDEYFDAGTEFAFIDLDLLAIGPVVEQVARDFDRYWTSGSAYPAATVLEPPTSDSITRLASPSTLTDCEPAAREYLEAVTRTPFVHDLLSGTLGFIWAPTRLVSDDPAKGLGRGATRSMIAERLRAILLSPTRTLDLVSAYFVPTTMGVRLLTDLGKQGVKIRVVTNALESTDVAAVHAGYAKRRKALLRAGVRLFEVKRSSDSPAQVGRRLGRSSASSLHTKMFQVDQSCAFVGSFNFDPRSVRLNTEMGFVVESPVLASEIAATLIDVVPTRAYEVRLTEGNRLQWVEQREAGTVIHDREPGVGFGLRCAIAILSLLPIESLL